MSGALFDLPGVPLAAAEREETLSPDQRRTRRQYELLLAGQHPLSRKLGRPLRLHQDAAPADDPKAPGLRCGSCRFRELLSYGPRNWPKCTIGGRVSHGAGTDVRAWWPACRDYQPKETT